MGCLGAKQANSSEIVSDVKEDKITVAPKTTKPEEVKVEAVKVEVKVGLLIRQRTNKWMTLKQMPQLIREAKRRRVRVTK